MQPQDYCQQKVAADGSDLHYACLTLEPRKQRGIFAISAFLQQLLQIQQRSGETGVIQSQLEWWRQEVDNIKMGKAQHPAAIECQWLSQEFAINTDWLEEILNGIRQETEHNHPLVAPDNLPGT